MEHEAKRLAMISDQVRGRGVRDERVLAALASVPRERFVAARDAGDAYADTPLGIGDGQTISQPYIVARMLEALALRGGERVLDVGTGSGYAAALLSLLAAEVISIERIPSLAARARTLLQELGYPVEVILGDGTLGAPLRGPFDAIAVAACAPRVPPALVAQLAPGGRMVLPVKDGEEAQVLIAVTRVGAGPDVTIEQLERVRFVPLIGAQGEP